MQAIIYGSKTLIILLIHAIDNHPGGILSCLLAPFGRFMPGTFCGNNDMITSLTYYWHLFVLHSTFFN